MLFQHFFDQFFSIEEQGRRSGPKGGGGGGGGRGWG